MKKLAIILTAAVLSTAMPNVVFAGSTSVDAFTEEAPQQVVVYGREDVKYLFLAENGMYFDDDENEYRAFADYQSFVRMDSSHAEYHLANFDPTVEAPAKLEVTTPTTCETKSIYLREDGLYCDTNNSDIELQAYVNYNVFYCNNDGLFYYVHPFAEEDSDLIKEAPMEVTVYTVYGDCDVKNLYLCEDGMYYDDDETPFGAFEDYEIFMDMEHHKEYHTAHYEYEVEAPATVEVYSPATGDTVTLRLIENGMYYDDKEEEYDPLVNYTVFFKTSDGTFCYDKTIMDAE